MKVCRVAVGDCAVKLHIEIDADVPRKTQGVTDNSRTDAVGKEEVSRDRYILCGHGKGIGTIGRSEDIVIRLHGANGIAFIGNYAQRDGIALLCLLHIRCHLTAVDCGVNRDGVGGFHVAHEGRFDIALIGRGCINAPELIVNDSQTIKSFIGNC